MKQIITKGNILEKNWEKDAENFKSENPDQYNNFLQIIPLLIFQTKNHFAQQLLRSSYLIYFRSFHLNCL